MRWTRLFSIVVCVSVLWGSASAWAAKHRMIIMADMGNEPDEEQQMVHMMMCNYDYRRIVIDVE